MEMNGDEFGLEIRQSDMAPDLFFVPARLSTGDRQMSKRVTG